MNTHEGTKPFRVEMRLRNNRMAKIRDGRTQASMDKQCGTSIGTWGLFEGLKQSPIALDRRMQKSCFICGKQLRPQRVVCTEHVSSQSEAEATLPGRWRKAALRIADGVFMDPEWLWPECVQSVRGGRMVSVEVSKVQAQQLSAMEVVSQKELVTSIRGVLKTLTPREEEVIKQRFGFDCDSKTQDEVAEEFEVSKERIRQIEARALRKLRHPARTSKIRGEVYEEPETPELPEEPKSYNEVHKDLIAKGLAYTDEELVAQGRLEPKKPKAPRSQVLQAWDDRRQVVWNQRLIDAVPLPDEDQPIVAIDTDPFAVDEFQKEWSVYVNCISQRVMCRGCNLWDRFEGGPKDFWVFVEEFQRVHQECKEEPIG